MDNKICVYAIAKNESKFVDRWCDSMCEADYVVVLDTGSEDNTVDLLKKRGVIVGEKKFKKFRFDEARNESLKLVPEDCNILVSTDLDEVFEHGWAKALRENWVEGKHNRCCYKYDQIIDENDVPIKTIIYDKIHSRNWHWKYPVHELMVFEGDDASYEHLYLCDEIRLKHYPDRTKPRSQYLKLLELRRSEDPEDIYGLFYLATEYIWAGELEKAEEAINQGLSMDNLPDLYRFAFYLKLTEVCGRKNDKESIKACFEKALALNDSYIEPYYWLGDYYFQSDTEKSYKILYEGYLKSFHHNDWIETEDLWSTAKYYDLLSLAAFYSGRKLESLYFVEKAIEKEPNNERLFENKRLIINALEMGKKEGSNMRSLTEIANECNTDKGTKTAAGHGFTDFYEQYIEKYKGKNPRILEIGIFHGESLNMWDKFFEGNCEIYGIDIEPKSSDKANIHTIHMDQSLREHWQWFIDNIGGEFDIIIDDGSHIPEHQAISLYYGTKLLKNGGIYILEDLHTNISPNPMNEYPLHALEYGDKMVGLTDEENKEVWDRIDRFAVFVRHNQKITDYYKERSITSVIKFKERI